MDAKKPFHPQKWPFFYGYWIVLCSIIGMVFSVPGQTVGVSVFTDFLLENLEIKRLTFSAAYMVGTIASGLVIGKVGRLLDTVGNRVMAALASLGLGIVLLFFSQIDVLARGVYDFLGLGYGVIVAVILTLSFFLLRFSGQGILSLASGTMILRWFVKKRGRINGIAGIFISLMFAGAPLALDGLIQQFGWRGAYVNMAVSIGVGLTVLILIFYRDNPEQCGLLPDGGGGGVTEAQGARVHEVDMTLAQAKRTYSFWVYDLTLSMCSLFGTALAFHVVSIFEVGGVSRETALQTFLPSSVIAVTVNLVAGWLSDFTRLRYFLWLHILGMLVACVGVFGLTTPLGFYLLIIGRGVYSGTYSLLTSVTWPRFFGRKHLGAISGYNVSHMVLGSGIGPFVFGWSFDYSGNYLAAIFACALVLLGLLLAAFRAHNPQQANALLEQPLPSRV